ncbi:unnamed protein product [Sphagnum jensenii]|uniref:Uncharacterized protein n=1 Tax=Sphagnum jensenii TaxID=128206 RepID=A0ABP0VJ39_9BRYO
MRRMALSHVLMSGMGGFGVEMTKNVILGGVESVTIHDETNCQAAATDTTKAASDAAKALNIENISR